MATGTATSGRGPSREVIDLVSSDDEDASVGRQATPRPRSIPQVDHDIPEDFLDLPNGFFDDAFPLPEANDLASSPPTRVTAPATTTGMPRGEVIIIDGEEIFIPDEEPLDFPSRHSQISQANADPYPLQSREVTADSCLQQVLEIFPDISHDHVVKLYNDFDVNDVYETLPGPARLDNIVEQLASGGGNYPKQEKGKQAVKKRKREDSTSSTADTKRWEAGDRDVVPQYLKGPIRAMLKADFPEVPVDYIHRTLDIYRHLYPTYIALAKDKEDGDADPKKRKFGKGRSRATADALVIATNCGWPPLIEELEASRGKVESIRLQRAAEDAKKRAEQENLRRATERGETAECQACFDDLPMNRQIHCDGVEPHFTCYECIITYIKSEVGDSRCRVLCTAGCGAVFAPHQLNQLDDKQLLEKLAELEQEKAIRDAGLEDLEECPFCDYKAILPPIEEDFEFRCANPECEKVSCRRCKATSHIPISCEQHAKDNKVNSRHKIEEAMTAALVRSCNKCKKQFIKEYGCNKMSCPSCGNLQCYVCSESLRNYDHFDRHDPTGRHAGGGGNVKCPLYDNVEERHEREVKEAEEAARAEVVANNPDVTVEDLEIRVSDAVKKSTSDRMQRGANPYGGIPAYPVFPPGIADRLRAANRAFLRPAGHDEYDGALDDDAIAGAVDRARRRRHREQELPEFREQLHRLEMHNRMRLMLAGHEQGDIDLEAEFGPPPVPGFGLHHIHHHDHIYHAQQPGAAPRPRAEGLDYPAPFNEPMEEDRARPDFRLAAHEPGRFHPWPPRPAIPAVAPRPIDDGFGDRLRRPEIPGLRIQNEHQRIRLEREERQRETRERLLQRRQELLTMRAQVRAQRQPNQRERERVMATDRRAQQLLRDATLGANPAEPDMDDVDMVRRRQQEIVRALMDGQNGAAGQERH